MFNINGNKWRHVFAWLVAGAIILISGWVGDGLEGNTIFYSDRNEYLPVKWCVLGGLVIAWILLTMLLDWLLLYILPLRTLSQKKQAEPHRILITPISGSKKLLDTIELRLDGYWLVHKDKDAASPCEARFADGLDSLFAIYESSSHSVVPLLRSLKCHSRENTLKQVHFLASSQSKEFADGLKLALANCITNVEIHVYEHALDFEDIDNVYHALDEIINRVTKDKGVFTDKDIIVDFTGGQKPTSVALALYTLQRNIVCQYVQTGGDKEVLQYDMALRSATGHS